MAELGLDNVTVTFGGSPLLERISLQIERGERVGLLGRNGSGKSTLLRVLAGELAPDQGLVVKRQGLRIAGLSQQVPKSMPGTVSESIHAALRAAGVEEGWQSEARCDQVIAQLALDPGARVETLSAGAKRRVLLAQALAIDPDVLLLDEPTNHLDIDTIRNLEEHLVRRGGALVLVTHDRAFLQAVATRILDLDRARLRAFDCRYDQYLERKEAVLAAERHEAAEFDKKLAQEEVWIRRGIEARRTRNMGRVRALKAMRQDRLARREEVGRAKATVQEGSRSGQIVLRATDLKQSFGGRELLGGLSLEVQRGDRIGIVGPNGCGKTTLLKILLGELAPEGGTIRHGTNLEVARFDQLHATLDHSKTIQENLSGDGDTVMVGGVARNVIGYMKDFLFRPEQVREPVSRLSGGERNRVQLAKILARPCNLLVLDEPTNDLDLETLELLEDLLLEYQGTLLLVSHDRAFLDEVVTSIVVFDDGRVTESVGGWSDWMARRAEGEPSKAQAKSRAKPAAEAAPKPRKLTYAEKIELDKLPLRIETLEREKSGIEAAMSDPAFYRGPAADITAKTARLAELGREIDAAYARWEALTALPT
ncbi:MAG: ATP-binding cassette domain-containing protein [Planctomycetota bacterium]|nr:ATP-binding cassette domain-containing protein [Planctomycetota bacterium]